jgi:uncharacterized protein (DUF885 family)
MAVSQEHPVFVLADRFVDAYAALAPMHATYAGIEGHDHRWGDLGPDGLTAELELLRSTRAGLEALPPAVDADDALAMRVIADHLDPIIEAHEHDDVLRDVAHIASTFPSLRDLLSLQDLATEDGRDAVLRRLDTLPEALEGWRLRLELGIERGVVAARRQTESIVGQLRDAVTERGGIARVTHDLTIAAPERAQEATRTLADTRDAVERIARWLEEVYLDAAPASEAAGAERYHRALRGLIGSDLDLVETEAWAWNELRGLLTRLRQVATRILPDADLAEVLHQLRTDPDRAAESPEHFRELMQERQVTALNALSGAHFDVPEPIRRVEVRLAPPGGALGAYYVGPSEDLRRPGSIWWSLGDRQTIPLFEEVSTAYHEGFPGHHLQIGIQTTLADRLSRAHRILIWNPGYGEGWALYAETLMDELGFLERPEYQVGYLTSSILRVLRVVIDIGLHLERRIPDDAPFAAGEPWTFDRAVDALVDVAALDRDYAVSEVTRYLGWPGQAISYAVGQREILRLREARRSRDGDRFDLRRFHADVLGSGPVGLDHLRELVLGEH